MIGAHRMAFLVANDAIDPDLLVMHSCDNRICVNPAHLSQGTHSENNHQAYDRARQVDHRGERSPRAKLSSLDVGAIRMMLAGGATQQSIADRFGVGRECVSKIATGRRWR